MQPHTDAALPDIQERRHTDPASFSGRAAWTVVRIALLLFCATPLHAKDSDEKTDTLPTIAERTKDCQRRDGLLTTCIDARKGVVWLEVPPPLDDTGEVGRYLYIESLATGLGSNPVGLDRGQLGPTRLVALRRVGGRLLVEELNLGFRARSDDEDERRAVRESFATSILWAGEIAAEDADGRALVDFTPFVVRDAHNVAVRLKQSNQGGFKLDKDRSVLNTGGCLSFPDNLEFEALLTFSADDPGRHVRSTAPTADSVTLTQHHSVVRLPDDGYRPRRFDPRSASFPIDFVDYAAPLTASIETRWIARHRLEKVDPTAERSLAVEPIIYYVDRGAPEPVRSALIEGASWWARAFEAAGFVDAFRVEVMPEGAHPLDVRYNVIQWVHRSTRGWSYGGSVTDPRTGEIIKGHVSLGSLRVRQDRLLFEGLAGTDKTGSGEPNDPVQLALARIRQLSAHEVGHTLGFTHNFAASTYGDRASVMDYPAPRIGITEIGELDLSDAYAVGIGIWDIAATRFAYSQFPPGTDEDTALARIIEENLREKRIFLSDDDARPAGAAQPLANLWDNGDDPVAALDHALRVRAIALAKFGEHNVTLGTPLAQLQEVLAPVYFHHRYQLDAAVKTIGGLDYAFALRGDGQPAGQPIDAERQRAALASVLKCLEPEVLDLPEPVLGLLLPRPFGYSDNREMFQGHNGLTFDPLGAAASAADMAITGLLNTERCARVVDFHRRDERLPALGEILDALIESAFGGTTKKPRAAELRRTVRSVVVDRLITLAADAGASPSVRSAVENALVQLQLRLEQAAPTAWPHTRHLARRIKRFLDRPDPAAAHDASAPDAPPGSPIGSPSPDLGRCSMDPHSPGAP